MVARTRNKAATPANKDASTTVEPKAEKQDTGKVYVLTSPTGQEYRTSNKAEAMQLHRTQGYALEDN